MKTILLCISLLYSFVVFSQKNDPPKKDPPLEVALIKMSKFPIADFPRKSIPVSDIRVIQLVKDSIDLGYAMKGMDNYIITLKPSKPLSSFFQEQVNRMYEDDYKDEGVKILWVVKDLRIGEKTGFMEYAYTRFNADAYISDSGLLFKKVCTMDTVFVAESGGDVTRWHGEDIENAFRALVKRTLLTGKAVLKQPVPELAIQEIVESSRPNLNIPIMTDTIYKEGAYANYAEFLNNKPSIADYEPIVIDKKKIRFIRNAQGEQKDTLSIWGLCKNGEIYKYYEDVLIPIEKQGAGFIVSDYVKNSNKRNRNIGFLSLIGGITGGVVGGTAVALIANAAKNKVLLVKSIPYIQKPAKQPQASCIDMDTGEFTF